MWSERCESRIYGCFSVRPRRPPLSNCVPNFSTEIFPRKTFSYSTNRRHLSPLRDLALVAEVIILLLNQSPGPIRLTQNWPVLRGRDAYHLVVVPLFFLSPAMSLVSTSVGQVLIKAYPWLRVSVQSEATSRVW